MRRVPSFGQMLIPLGELSFGVYLIHQYPIEAFGRALRGLPGGISIAEPLPGSLAVVLVLFALTLAASTVLVARMRRYRLGRFVLGG
jgi:peptidoglycan/LPS O-acetylase OafA/YrhL